MQEKYTDQTVLTFGKHKMKPLMKIPAHYLLWLFENGLRPGPLRTYIVENMNGLLQERDKANGEKNNR